MAVQEPDAAKQRMPVVGVDRDEVSRPREACTAFRRALDLWKGLEAGGAAIDEEQRAERAAVEKAARCSEG